MPYSQDTGMSQRGGNDVRIETGQIINVDMAHWTVDIRTMYSHRLLLDVQVGTPYLHFHSGEGIYAMPEAGAKVQVCTPSDDRPFVLSFITTFERGATGDGTTQPDTGDGEESEVTFASGRPKLQQGDLMMRCRDGNQIWLHRGGVIEIEATAVAKRVYIPITNMIRDVCENYQMLNFGGEMLWTTSRDDADPEGEAKTVFTLAARNAAQEAKNTVMVTIGHVDEETRLRCVVAPNAIDSTSRAEDAESAVYDFTVDSSGNVSVTTKGNYTREVTGTLEDTVSGTVTQNYGETSTTVNGGQTVEVSGEHSLQAAGSTETISGQKVLDASMTKVGGGASTPFILATSDVILFLAAHKHATPAGLSGPPDVPVIAPAGQSTKSLGE